jgi:hypothetical protein
MTINNGASNMSQTAFSLTPPGIGVEDLAYLINEAFGRPTDSAMVEDEIGIAMMETAPHRKAKQAKNPSDARQWRQDLIFGVCDCWITSPDIAAKTGINRSTLTGDLIRMVDAGLVDRRPHQEGRVTYNAYRAI